MKRPKTILAIWSLLLGAGAIGAYFYVKITSTPVFSVVSTQKQEDGSIVAGGQKSWFSRITDKESSDLYPATEIAFDVDMGESKASGKEFYYILSVSKLGEDKFRIVEKKLNNLNLLYSVKKDGDGFSVNISFKDKVSMQKVAEELKNSL
jgi:hypothetical protein